MGPPGVGKGTYASLLAPRLGLKHVVVGDLLRNEILEGTALGLEITSAVRQGELIPDDVVLKFVISHLQGLDGFILDGMPRTLQQAIELDALMPLDLILHFDMDEEVMLQKTCGRRIGPGNHVYNLAYVRYGEWDMPPHLPVKTRRDEKGQLFCAHGMELRPNQLVQCSSCNKGLRKREDDTVEIWSERLQTYKDLTLPILDHYVASNKCVDFSIIGDVEVCFPQVLARLEEHCIHAADVQNNAVRHMLTSRL